MIIYLDMDGVCSDFDTQLLNICPEAQEKGLGWEYWRAKPGTKGVRKTLGINYDQMWSRIFKAGTEFWSDMNEYSWYQYLYDNLTQLGRVVYLTSPSHCPFAAMGKMEWLQARHGPNFEDFIITNNKYFCARPDSVLIDDRDKYLDQFTEQGGNVIVFPQLWNDKYEEALPFLDYYQSGEPVPEKIWKPVIDRILEEVNNFKKSIET